MSERNLGDIVSQPKAYNVVLQQTAIGDYRQNVLSLIVSKLGDTFHIYTGREYFYDSLKTKIDVGASVSYLNNIFLLGRRFLYQPNMFFLLMRTPVVILELNPRIISVWLVLIGRYLLGRPVILWGHAWPREGRYAKSDWLRHMMRSLAKVVVVYTQTQHKELQEKMPKKHIIAAPNALYLKADMTAVDSLVRPNFLYVGRLVAEKKVDLLIKGFCKAKPYLPSDSRLVIVGSGPERQGLDELVKHLPFGECVEFKGHVADVVLLKAFYQQTIASVSAGYVGLSLTQSFGFGVPMIIADHEPHAPEIEAAVADENCLFFEANNADDLAKVMLQMVEQAPHWIARGEQIAVDCRRRYSAETMADKLIEAIELAKK